MSVKRIEVGIKLEDWKELANLALRSDMTLEKVIDSILEAAIKVMKEGNDGKKD